MNKLLLDRRRAWFKCDPKVKLNREDGTAEITVTIDQPDPHGIAENTVLYGFEEADVQKKGRYLGEFKVTKSDEKQKTVVLVPTSPLSPREIDRLATAKRPWELYEVMPHDSHDVFASLSDEEKKAMLPADESAGVSQGRQARRQGRSGGAGADGKYVRPLRDYQVLFAPSAARTLLADQIDAATRDMKLVEEALAQAQEQEEAAKQDVAAAKEDVEEVRRPARRGGRLSQDAASRSLDAAKADIDQLLENNQDMAGQIAKLQLEAARRIDQRTRAMAQSGAGGT